MAASIDPSPVRSAPSHPQHADDVTGFIQLHAALCCQNSLHGLQDAGCHSDIAADKHVSLLEAQHAVNFRGQLCPQEVLHVGLGAGLAVRTPRPGACPSRILGGAGLGNSLVTPSLHPPLVPWGCQDPWNRR